MKLSAVATLVASACLLGTAAVAATPGAGAAAPARGARPGFVPIIAFALVVVALTASASRRWPSPVPQRRLSIGTGYVPMLDSMRGLAILSVVAFHVFTTMWVAWGSPAGRRPLLQLPLAAGNLGVDLFFVLSGFLVLRSWNSVRARAESVGQACRTYARRRLLRIVPLYWFMLLTLIPLVRPEWIRTAAGRWNIFLLSAMQQWVKPELPMQLNGVTWSLTPEVQFYVLLPFLAVLMLRWKPKYLLPILIGISVLWRYSTWKYLDGPAEIIVGRIDQFGLGMGALYLVEARDLPGPKLLVSFLRSRVAALVLPVSIAALVLFYGAHFQDGSRWVSAVVHPIAGLLFSAYLAHLFVATPPRFLNFLPLRFLGVISYSLYLWHFPFLQLAGRRGWRQTGLEGVVVLVGLCLAAVVVSYVAFVLIENPLHSSGRENKERTPYPPQTMSRSAASPPVGVSAR